MAGVVESATMQDWEGKLTQMAKRAHPMPAFVLWTGASCVLDLLLVRQGVPEQLRH